MKGTDNMHPLPFYVGVSPRPGQGKDQLNIPKNVSGLLLEWNFTVLVIARVIARKISIVYLNDRVKISYRKDICPKFW